MALRCLISSSARRSLVRVASIRTHESVLRFRILSIATLSVCSISFAENRSSAALDGVPEYAERLRFPGSNKQQIIEVLQHLRTGYLGSNSPFENMRVNGRMAVVTAKWKAGSEDLTVDKMPAAEWENFTLTIKDGKKRFEHGYTQKTSDESLEMTVYRLFDGDSLYKLDGTALVISRPLAADQHWVNNAAFDFYQSELVRFNTSWYNIPDFLDNLTKLIMEDREFLVHMPYFNWSHAKLHLWRDNGRIVLQADAIGSDRQTVWIDPNQGFRMTKERVESGRRQAGLHIREERDVSHRELAPGTYFPQRATIFAATLGTAPERDGGAGWVKRELEFSDVEFGEFEVDPLMFDPNALPIPVGANVSDRRGDQPVGFVYGRLPIREQLLANALASKEEHRSFWQVWLIGLNVLVCIVLLLLIAQRLQVRA